MRYGRSSGAIALGLLFVLLATGCERAPRDEEVATQDGVAPATEQIEFDVTSDPQDSVIFEEKMAWMRAQRVDTLPVGEAIVALGRTFVGAPYTPKTLELEGPERLIVNLRELDCVTFIESTLALVRTFRAGNPDYGKFKRELVRIRYRDGKLNGYPSRLHYFSEWIANNQAKGIVEDITASLGGRVDPEPLNFMTLHRDAYRQLADSAIVAEIARIQETLTGRQRYYIPENEIDRVAPNIRNGDIIGATSTLPGLDVAHTGIAIWQNNQLHLMHAPLVGTVVEISVKPLGERIRGIDAQDGIMVARPLDVTPSR